jgi:hypothetical protein
MSKDELIKTIDDALVKLSEIAGVNHISAFIVDGNVCILSAENLDELDYFRPEKDDE